MHIKLKNKKLYFGDYKVKCSIGKRGISSKKKEGDKCTPRGKFLFKAVLYRKDRVNYVKTHLKKIIIKKNLGWCDDPRSKNYNKLVKLPFQFSHEKLYKKKNVYDIVLVLSYNLNPIIKNKGSAIFLHLADKKYKPTNGCVAISKKNMKSLLTLINRKTKIIIS